VKSIPEAKSTNVRVPVIFRVIGAGLRALDFVVPPLAARIAARLFLTPRRLPSPASEAASRQRATQETRLVASHNITIRTWGKGPAILLLHGWEGRGTQLGTLAESLANEGYRVIAPDFPAHGDSPGRRSNLIEFAAIVAALIREEEPVAIVAHSFGSAATTVALRDVPFAGRLIYIAPPENFSFFTETFGRMLGLSDDLAKRMERTIERRFAIDWSQLRGAALGPQMTAPLLVIHDEDDADVPARFGRDLAAAWPRSTLMLTRKLGHRRILRDPVVIRAAIDFISNEKHDHRDTEITELEVIARY
jgi:pimeloyl-ACP methyl ester carboxylesterase